MTSVDGVFQIKHGKTEVTLRIKKKQIFFRNRSPMPLNLGQQKLCSYGQRSNIAHIPLSSLTN